MRGIPVLIASEMAFTVLTLHTTAPTSAGRPPLGTIRPMTRLMSIFSAPWGYLVFATVTSMLSSAAHLAWNSSTASGLLSSMTITPLGASTAFMTAFRP